MLSVNENEHMFIEKYRPTTIEECILPKHDKEVFLELIKSKKLPHLILQSNSPGTGKTTVALALANDVNAEIMFVNGSGVGIDFFKNEATRFASSLSMEGRPKVLIIDEFDRRQLEEAQKYMRSFLEAHGRNCSVIITANNLEGIIPALRSRAKVIKFGSAKPSEEKQMKLEMIHRCLAICKNENIEVTSNKVIVELVKLNFPDFRKTVGDLDHYSSKNIIDEGILDFVTKNRGQFSDVVEAIKTKNLAECRKLATKYAPDYAYFTEAMIDVLYPLIEKKSILRMYELIGENNQMFGLAANAEVHMMLLFVQMIQEIKFLG